MKISLCSRTLLEPFLIMLTLEDHTLCLEQLYSQIVIKSVYTCMAFYCYYSTLVVHTLCLDQFHCCTFIHKSSLCSLLDCEYNCTVQLYTRYCQPVLYTILQNQFTDGRIVSTNHRARPITGLKIITTSLTHTHTHTHTHTQNVHM